MLSRVCGVFDVVLDSWISGRQFCTRPVWVLSRASRLVLTDESLKIVFEKTELKEKEEPKSDSWMGDLGRPVGSTTVGSRGGLFGGMGSVLLPSVSDCF